MTCTFQYNQPLLDLSHSELIEQFKTRQRAVVEGFDTVLKLLTSNLQFLLSEQEDEEKVELRIRTIIREQLALQHGVDSLDRHDMETILADIRDSHEHTLARCLKHRGEIATLRERFATAHCLEISDDELLAVHKLFSQLTQAMLFSVASNKFEHETDPGRLPNFTQANVILMNAIIFARVCLVIEKSDEVTNLLEVYPFNIYE